MVERTTIDALRMVLSTILIALAALGVSSRVVFAADAFPGNTLSGISGSFLDSNTTSTGETGEPATYGSGNLNTNWYNWTAPATGSMTIQTCSATQTTFDTTLIAYTGAALNALTTIATNDDACANTSPNAYASLITFTAVSGTNYKIQVDGYANNTGTYLLAYAFTPPTVTIANTTQGNETGPVSGVMTVTQSAISASNTVVSYSVGGTATSGSDYTALSGTVTIPAGSTSATIPIPVINDAIVEGAETVVVTLTGVTSGVSTLGATLAATNTIADNDAGTVRIANSVNGAEAGPVNGVLTVTQTAVSSLNTVIAYSVAGTATAGTDYTALSGSVTIPAGSLSATITIPVIPDVVAEGAETVVVTLTSITSGNITLGAPLAATNTIADNGVGSLTIVTTDNAATETPGNTGAFTVVLGARPSGNVTVTIGTSTQCTFAPTPLTFTTVNWNVAQTVTVTPIDDLVVEGPHTCSPASVVANGGGYASVAGAPPTINITDNDVASFTISKAASAANISVPGTLTYTITVSNSGNVPLTGPTISDSLAQGSPLTLTSGPTLTSGDAAPLGTLNVGEVWTYTATYAVTQANINKGAAITNSATFDTTETAPLTSNTATTTITRTPALTVVKTANTAGPVNAGQSVTYTYKVKNTGNVTLSGVTVGEAFNGFGTPPTPAGETLSLDAAPTGDSSDGGSNGSWDTLAPGDEVTFTAPYVVTQQDVENLQ